MTYSHSLATRHPSLQRNASSNRWLVERATGVVLFFVFDSRTWEKNECPRRNQNTVIFRWLRYTNPLFSSKVIWMIFFKLIYCLYNTFSMEQTRPRNSISVFARRFMRIWPWPCVYVNVMWKYRCRRLCEYPRRCPERGSSQTMTSAWPWQCYCHALPVELHRQDQCV